MSQPLRIVCLLFPQVTQLDLTGPAQIFARLPGVELSLAWHRVEAVPTDAGFSILPTVTLADAPQADVLFVPGGFGAFDLLEDEVVLQFVRDQAAGARFVTSVCTGSFVLAAAGLLRGKRATSHWASIDMLARFGAVPTAERVVRDGTVFTGAGVTSGMDFALVLTAEMFGDELAKRIQLAIEYDPHPPFDAGSPNRPDADPTAVAEMSAAMHRLRGPLVDQAVARLSGAGSVPEG